MLPNGARVGRYVVDAKVGAHGGVEVYRGHDPQLGRAVAVKLMPGTSERFHREARATALLNHPHIVATLDVFDHNGRLCIVRAVTVTVVSCLTGLASAASAFVK